MTIAEFTALVVPWSSAHTGKDDLKETNDAANM
jgi:hypothetical protein